MNTKSTSVAPIVDTKTIFNPAFTEKLVNDIHDDMRRRANRERAALVIGVVFGLAATVAAALR